MIFIAQVCQKHTRVGLSDVFEIEAVNEYYACDALAERAGIVIDGSSNYAELVRT